MNYESNHFIFIILQYYTSSFVIFSLWICTGDCNHIVKINHISCKKLIHKEFLSLMIILTYSSVMWFCMRSFSVSEEIIKTYQNHINVEMSKRTLLYNQITLIWCCQILLCDISCSQSDKIDLKCCVHILEISLLRLVLNDRFWHNCKMTINSRRLQK